MFSKKILSSIAASAILLAPIANANSHLNAGLENMVATSMSQIKEKASVNLAQQEALNLLVYTSLLSNEVGAISEIPAEIKTRYETAAKAFFASPSIIGAGLGTAYLAKQSLNELVSIVEPITALFRLMAQYATVSIDFSSEVIERIIPEWIFKSSSQSAEAVVDLMKVLLRPLFTKGVGVSVGSSAVAGSLYSSVFITINTSEEAMTYETLRSLVGYDKELGHKIDVITAQLGQVFALTPEKESRFKEDLMNAIITEGIRTDFNTKEMKVDTFEVLKSQLSESEVNVVTMLKSVYTATENKSSHAEIQGLERDVTTLLAISAVLETILETKNLTRKQRSEISLRLVNTQNVINQIKRNMR